MNENNSLKVIFDKFVSILYRYVLPVITVFSLLILSQFVSRPKIMGSGFLDLFSRVLICLWFCLFYIRLPYLSKKYRPFPGSTSTKADVSSREKLLYMVGAIVFGVFFAVFTWWILKLFLPISSLFINIVAFANGFLFSVPLIAQYEVFKQ